MTADRYNEALDELFGAPFAKFVAERTRLAGELKAAGDKAGAYKLAALKRPSLGAWAVNQLYRHAKQDLDALFAAADEVREGDPDAARIHREILGKLRAKAADLLTADGNAAAEPTLRKVAQNLQAIAAAGEWDPDEPGTLVVDRDPPGFEAFAGVPLPPPPPKAAASAPKKKAKAEPEPDKAEAARVRAAERRQLETAARAAERELAAADRELESARSVLESARERFARAEAAAAAARTKAEQAIGALAQLDATEAPGNGD